MADLVKKLSIPGVPVRSPYSKALADNLMNAQAPSTDPGILGGLAHVFAKGTGGFLEARNAVDEQERRKWLSEALASGDVDGARAALNEIDPQAGAQSVIQDQRTKDEAARQRERDDRLEAQRRDAAREQNEWSTASQIRTFDHSDRAADRQNQFQVGRDQTQRQYDLENQQQRAAEAARMRYQNRDEELEDRTETYRREDDVRAQNQKNTMEVWQTRAANRGTGSGGGRYVRSVGVGGVVQTLDKITGTTWEPDGQGGMRVFAKGPGHEGPDAVSGEQFDAMTADPVEDNDGAAMQRRPREAAAGDWPTSVVARSADGKTGDFAYKRGVRLVKDDGTPVSPIALNASYESASTPDDYTARRKHAQKMNEKNAKALSDSTDSVAGTNGLLETFEAMNFKSPGPLPIAVAEFAGPYFQLFGINPQNATMADVSNAIQFQFAKLQKAGWPGAVSNYEGQMFLKASPSLKEGTPISNYLKAETMKASVARLQDVRQLSEQYLEEKRQAGVDPLLDDGLQSYIKANIKDSYLSPDAQRMLDLTVAGKPRDAQMFFGQLKAQHEGAARERLGQDRAAAQARLSGTPTPAANAPAAAAGQQTPAATMDPLAQARDAISRGAPRDKVIERLRQSGIDTTGL
jgi:hypothetical protein